MIQSILSVRHTSSDFTFVVAVVDVKTKSRLVKFSSVIFSVFFPSYFDSMLSDVFIVYYPKNYIPSEQKAFEEAEHDFIPSDNHLSKDNGGEIQIYEGHSKTISYLSTYSNVWKFILFNVNNIQWSDSDCYI